MGNDRHKKGSLLREMGRIVGNDGAYAHIEHAFVRTLVAAMMIRRRPFGRLCVEFSGTSVGVVGMSWRTKNIAGGGG